MTREITNWRSLGGYTGFAGRKVKDGLLFRCGQLYNLTSYQKEQVQNKYQIKRVFDFRGEEERKQFPDYLWSGLDYVVIDVLKDAQVNQASVDEIVSGNNQAEEDMLTTYEELALQKSAQNGYHQFLMALIDDPVPTAFHCFAGKDRTGVAAALILKSLGVSDDQIFADYLKTIEARKQENQEILDYLRDQLTSSQLKDVAVALTVQKSYLERYFSAIKQNYGDFDNYLIKGLDLPSDFKSKMRQIYLVQN